MHGLQSIIRPMSEASSPYFCAACEAECVRVFDLPHFVEDRCRFARNPRTGENFSDMLGTSYPQDRRERDALYKMKGIEPVSKSDMPSQWKVAAEYAQHVKTGGGRLSKEKENDLVEKPDLSGIKSVSQMMRESNVNFGSE
jgi:hypothetical protein